MPAVWRAADAHERRARVALKRACVAEKGAREAERVQAVARLAAGMPPFPCRHIENKPAPSCSASLNARYGAPASAPGAYGGA